MHACMYECMYVCIYVYTYVHVYINGAHAHICTQYIHIPYPFVGLKGL